MYSDIYYFRPPLSPFRNKNFPSASLSLKKKKFQSGSLHLQKALGSLDLFGVGIVVQCGSRNMCSVDLPTKLQFMTPRGWGEWLPTFTSDV